MDTELVRRAIRACADMEHEAVVGVNSQQVIVGVGRIRRMLEAALAPTPKEGEREWFAIRTAPSTTVLARIAPAPKEAVDPVAQDTPELEPAEDRPASCPTCGSDDPEVRNMVVVERWHHGHIERVCPDSWHNEGA